MQNHFQQVKLFFFFLGQFLISISPHSYNLSLHSLNKFFAKVNILHDKLSCLNVNSSRHNNLSVYYACFFFFFQYSLNKYVKQIKILCRKFCQKFNPYIFYIPHIKIFITFFLRNVKKMLFYFLFS